MKSLQRNRLAENSQQALEPRIMLASHEAGSAMAMTEGATATMAEGGAATGALAMTEGATATMAEGSAATGALAMTEGATATMAEGGAATGALAMTEGATATMAEGGAATGALAMTEGATATMAEGAATGALAMAEGATATMATATMAEGGAATSALAMAEGATATMAEGGAATGALAMAEGATGALALDEGSHTADDGHGHDDLDRPEPEPLTITAAEANSALQSTGSFPDLPLRIDGNDGKVASQEVNANPTDIREFTIGVEIGNSVFNDVYGGDFAAANEAANSLVSNLNETWEQSIGARFRLSKAEIRRRPEADPFNFEQKGVQNRAAHVQLRDYWKNNPQDVGEEPDFIAVHAGGAPSGTALSDQRTIFLGGRSQTSWADGTARHEMGHVWGLPHVEDTDFRFDAQSRPDGDSAGGDVKLFSPMVGNANNFGRFSSDEVNRMLQAREDFASLGEVVEAGENIRPYAKRDIISSSATGGGSLVNALANDFDANGDSLSLAKADTVSFQGGRVAIESGQLRYTPPEDASAGDRDFFHYTANDGNGGGDRHGMVEVNLT